MKMKARRKRLQARIKDFERLLQSSCDAKVMTRKKTGGYRCPGSYK